MLILGVKQAHTKQKYNNYTCIITVQLQLTNCINCKFRSVSLNTLVTAVSDGSQVNSKSCTNSWIQLEIMLSDTIKQNNYFTPQTTYLSCY